jgi:hypothetical protein
MGLKNTTQIEALNPCNAGMIERQLFPFVLDALADSPSVALLGP